MFKFLFIIGLIALFVYLIVRRLSFSAKDKPKAYLPTSDWIEIKMDSSSLKRVAKQTLFSVLIGFVLLIIVLVIAAKFRIALFMLPISFYLIGQYFVLMNQIKALRKQQLFYNHRSQEVKVRLTNGDDLVFRLDTELSKIDEVRSVQKNNGILLGYYVLLFAHYKVVVPFILQENPYNKPFFEKLHIFPREIENKLFPII